jgi:single-stranded-DNA-specific exonuclease
MNPLEPASPAAAASMAHQPDSAAPDALPLYAWHEYPRLSDDRLQAGASQFNALQMQVLANRGLADAGAARAFMEGSWQAGGQPLKGIGAAIARLRQAGDAGERVVVYGDYDADGVTSCALMVAALRHAGIAADFYLPMRSDRGRGLNLAAIEEIARGGARLIVTTDCGTTNAAEVRHARELGVDVIITDHHPPQEAVADACAVVNPRQPGGDHPESRLAGVGVALRVAEALLAADPPALAALLDLVAIGTIGDVVSLTAENWRLVRAGLARLNSAPRPGLRALAEAVGLVRGAITERDVSYALAPCLNAAGRMGQPRLAVELLTTADAATAADLAAQLLRLNKLRQVETDVMLVEARAQAKRQLMDPHALEAALVVTRGDGWNLGLIGLVAGRLADDYHRPALAISVDGAECRGSARAPEGYNLVEALAEQPVPLLYFGGHARAAGFTVTTGDLDALLAHLRRGLQRPRAADDPADGAPPHAGKLPLAIDCELPLNRDLLERYHALAVLAPYGVDFPTPVFVARGAQVIGCWPSGPEGRNLRLRLRHAGVERVAMWSRQGARYAAVRALDTVDVAYSIELYARSDRDPEPSLRVLDITPRG